MDRWFMRGWHIQELTPKTIMLYMLCIFWPKLHCPRDSVKFVMCGSNLRICTNYGNWYSESFHELILYLVSTLPSSRTHVQYSVIFKGVNFSLKAVPIFNLGIHVLISDYIKLNCDSLKPPQFYRRNQNTKCKWFGFGHLNHDITGFMSDF